MRRGRLVSGAAPRTALAALAALALLAATTGPVGADTLVAPTPRYPVTVPGGTSGSTVVSGDGGSAVYACGDVYHPDRLCTLVPLDGPVEDHQPVTVPGWATEHQLRPVDLSSDGTTVLVEATFVAGGWASPTQRRRQLVVWDRSLGVALSIIDDLPAGTLGPFLLDRSGTEVLVSTTAPLAPDDDDGEVDTYRYDVGAGTWSRPFEALADLDGLALSSAAADHGVLVFGWTAGVGSAGAGRILRRSDGTRSPAPCEGERLGFLPPALSESGDVVCSTITGADGGGGFILELVAHRSGGAVVPLRADPGICFPGSGCAYPWTSTLVAPDASWVVAGSERFDADDPTPTPLAPVTGAESSSDDGRVVAGALDAVPWFGVVVRWAAPFTDVGPGHAFFGPISWLASVGVAGGFGDGSFRPTAVVSRQAMAAFLYRMAGSPG